MFGFFSSLQFSKISKNHCELLQVSRVLALFSILVFVTGCAAHMPTQSVLTEAQAHQRMHRPHIPSPAHTYVDYILVEKSKNRMYLMKKGEIVRDYHIAIGQNPVGHKVQEGDNRTPEGRYNLIYKNQNSQFYRSIALNYPNDRDKRIAARRGVNPGSAIVIHGQPNKHFGPKEGVSQAYNWTNGCIAVTNPEMGEIWRLVDIDTPIEIRP